MARAYALAVHGEHVVVERAAAQADLLQDFEGKSDETMNCSEVPASAGLRRRQWRGASGPGSLTSTRLRSRNIACPRGPTRARPGRG